MCDRHKQELLEAQLVAMLRMRGQLPRQAEKMYLDQFAKAALPRELLLKSTTSKPYG